MTCTPSETLEQMIDSHGLAAVLNAVEDICHGKADHLLSNWQDRQSAKAWEQAARAVERAAVKANDLGL